MKTKLILLALLLSTLNPKLSTLHAQGSLTPPGAPAPTMKSLDQIEARTAITNTASLVTIAQPGSYYLTHNLTVSTGDGIDINTNNVTLDLNGFTISSTYPGAGGYGIRLNSGLRNLTILNGFIQGGVTNNGSGVYSGSGFNYGIYYSGTVTANTRVSGVSVSGCLYHGIYPGLDDSTVVESCTVRTVGSAGIIANTIRGSMARDCGGQAISGEIVSDSRGESTGSLLCFAASVAQNCSGASTSGTGLYAGYVAIGCVGYSSSGTGLQANIANSCLVTHGTTNITHKYNMP